MKRIAILGAGPAGLLAAHAAKLCRVDAHVYSNLIKSKIGGAQFLHEAISDLTAPRPDGEINVFKWGNAAGYAQKVYGSPDAPTSFDLFEQGQVPAWSLRAAYDTLWDLYGGDNIWPGSGGLTANDVLSLKLEYDLVISTVPAKVLCCNAYHRFPAQPVFFSDGAMQQNAFEDFVCYSGDLAEPWYRSSRIFGVEQTEWPGSVIGPGMSLRLVQGIKPLNTNCDCCKGVLRAGRFGKWQKGVLTHHAFQEVLNALQQL